MLWGNMSPKINFVICYLDPGTIDCRGALNDDCGVCDWTRGCTTQLVVYISNGAVYDWLRLGHAGAARVTGLIFKIDCNLRM